MPKPRWKTPCCPWWRRRRRLWEPATPCCGRCSHARSSSRGARRQVPRVRARRLLDAGRFITPGASEMRPVQPAGDGMALPGGQGGRSAGMKYFVAGLEVYEETVCLVLRTGGRQLRIGLPFAETLTPDE